MIDLSSYSFSITHHGEAKCEPNHGFGPGLKQSYLITVVLGGNGTLSIDGQTHTLSRQDAFLIPPNILHEYQADEHDPWHYAWISFEVDGFDEIFSQIGRYQHTRRIENPDMILHYISLIKRHQVMGFDPSNKMREDAIIKLFLSELLLEESKSMQPAWMIRVQNIKDYIQNHYFEPITIQELADRFRYNRSYLCRMFKQIEGKSPKQYIIDLKIQIAGNMLLESDASVKNVSNSVGYEDSFTFSKIFKKRMGIAPQEYKKYMIEILKQHF